LTNPQKPHPRIQRKTKSSRESAQIRKGGREKKSQYTLTEKTKPKNAKTKTKKKKNPFKKRKKKTPHL